MKDTVFSVIDTEEKAYLLGWLATATFVGKEKVVVDVKRRNSCLLERLRCVVGEPELPIRDCEVDILYYRLTITSEQIASDLFRHLGKPASFPQLTSESLRWAFFRGLFDSRGHISFTDKGQFRVHMASGMYENLRDVSGVACDVFEDSVSWSNSNAVDFLAKLYANCGELYLPSKYELVCKVLNWFPHAHISGKLSYIRTTPEAPAPSKQRASDSGYDLHLIHKVKEVKGVHYYDTCIRVQPPPGMYFDLVGRSSIAKTGYMLANNIGIIDSSYQGSIIVALVKIQPDSPELELPAKLVQLIPRVLTHLEVEEVNSFETTERADQGGLGSRGLKTL